MKNLASRVSTLEAKIGRTPSLKPIRFLPPDVKLSDTELDEMARHYRVIPMYIVNTDGSTAEAGSTYEP